MEPVVSNFLNSSGRTILGVACLGLVLTNCSSSTLTSRVTPNAAKQEVTSSSKNNTVVWSNRFEGANFWQRWSVLKRGSWGLQNTKAIKDYSGKFSRVLRVRYPAGSASPTVTNSKGAPQGGVQVFANLGIPPQDSLRLSYYVRFSKDFDFVKGGKLPGLFGGTINNGRKIPDGTNGFSTRYMWRKDGDGEVYAYLPSSREHGTSIGRGNWRFQPGTWQHLEQVVVLNQPGKANGQIQMWLDGKKVLTKNGLTFRTTNALKIEGILFSTFFGGGDPSWATPKNVYVDFANFSVSLVK